MRIRAPEEFADVGVSNQFRPAPVDGRALVAQYEVVRGGLRDVADIVNAAHDNTMRSEAMQDSVELETRLSSLRAEMEAEAAPEGTDPTEWARTMPQRWETRATSTRQEIMRQRGRRPNTYLQHFDERANAILGREQRTSIERSAAQVIDIDRGAGIEMLNTLAARSIDPDLPETAEGDAPSRARYEQEYIAMAREFARRGTWSHSYAAERITGLQSERQTFRETEGRFQEARAEVDRLRDLYPDDIDSQLEAIADIPDPRLREQANDFAMADLGRDRAAFEAENQAARSRIEVLINAHGAAWQRYATQADVERVNRDPGMRAQIRAQLDALNDPTGSTAQSRSMTSGRHRVLLEDVGNSTDPLVGRVFMGINIDEPLSEQAAVALRNAGFMDAAAGTVISAVLTREDSDAIRDLQRQRRTGQTSNGGMVVDREVNDIVAYARANGLSDFGGDDDTGARRVMQNQFRAFVSQIVRDNFATGGARDLTPAEIASITQLALNRTNANGRGRNSTPLYRRRTGNNIDIGQIPSATAARIRRELGARGETAGLTTAQVDDLVSQTYADENRVRARDQR